MPKRKKDDEYRTFQHDLQREKAYSCVCLICNDTISSMKRSNVKRHFDTRHATFASKYPAGDSRKKACLELLRGVQTSQQQIRAWTRQGDCDSASFAGSLAAAYFYLASDESTDVSHLSQFRCNCKVYCRWHTAWGQSCCFANERNNKRGGFIQVFHEVR